MKKVLSQHCSMVSLYDQGSYLLTLHKKKKRDVKNESDMLGRINARLHRNRKKMISIIKNKLLSLIPKHEEKALRLLQEKLDTEDLWGENILEILLYKTILDPTTEPYEVSLGRTERDGKTYEFYLTEFWFHKFERRQLNIHDLYLVLENIYSKYWKEYVEIQMLYEAIPHKNAEDTLFLSIKIL